MTEQEIIDGNLLIAKFMGATSHRNGETLKFPGSMKGYFPERLKYNTSWSWLMPVVEKMELGDIKVKIEGNLVWVSGGYDFCRDYDWYGGSTNDSKMLSIWHGVVAFMKYWYKIGAPNPSTCDAPGVQPEKIPPAT